MGVFDSLGKAFGVSASKEMSIEEYMNSAEMADVDVMHEPADMYIKPVSISSENDVKLIQDELSRKNIILLSLTDLNKRPTTRTNVIAALKAYVAKINGDIAQIDDSRVLITPAKVKIIKSRKAAPATK
ncbi:Cell division protein SepF [uncultured archaeon]|nr:Cell division protein SepF [uncultured archaeon]